jgi:diguanylate cyclase (GGDEF)-like protein
MIMADDAVGQDRDELRRMLWRILPDRGLTLSMVSGLAGDRELTSAERQQLAVLLVQRGGMIYSDLLFTLTHQWFSPEEADSLWHGILKHKYEVSSTLGRNVRITVAAVDYLYNMRGETDMPSVVSEHSMWGMAEIAVRDSLTHLYDLPTFCMQLEIEVRRQKRYGIPVSVIIGDVDNFKAFNDRWGHLAGDHVLSDIAKVISGCAREVDVCARWGGDEFSVLVAQTEGDGAMAIAERIRVGIEETFRSSHVTLSLGVASCPEDATSVSRLIAKADRAMYRSKEHGNNRVRAACHETEFEAPSAS